MPGLSCISSKLFCPEVILTVPTAIENVSSLGTEADVFKFNVELNPPEEAVTVALNVKLRVVHPIRV